MTKTLIITLIVGPFWTWMFLLSVVGLLGCLLGLAWGWLFYPRYVSIARYKVARKDSELCEGLSSHTNSSKATVGLLKRLVEFRKKLQPVVEVDGWCEWEKHSRFWMAWHHQKYRGFLKREYGVVLPKGKVIVYSRWGEFAVLHNNTYYVIPWK